MDMLEQELRFRDRRLEDVFGGYGERIRDLELSLVSRDSLEVQHAGFSPNGLGWCVEDRHTHFSSVVCLTPFVDVQGGSVHTGGCSSTGGRDGA